MANDSNPASHAPHHRWVHADHRAVASKRAFDVWLRCVAQEVRDDGVSTSAVYLGLVHTLMSEPTPLLNKLPGLTPERAADQVCEAIVSRPHNITPPFVRPVDAVGSLLRVPTDLLMRQYVRRTERVPKPKETP